MNVYEIITQRILDQLEKGTVPWRKPWKTSASFNEQSNLFPCYPLGSTKPYDFLNQMLLDFQPGHYATFQTIKKNGGSVKKGEKSQIIAGWIYTKEERKNKLTGEVVTTEDGEPIMIDRFALRYYSVFCIETQTTGIDIATADIIEEPVTIQPCELAEKLIDGYITREGLKVTREKGSNRAYYSPVSDEVVVPHMAQFSQQAEYYSTLFHELTHSTMKASRCNREESRKGKSVAFGSEEYSKEELVAEIGAGALVNICGLETESSFNNSASYIAGWSKALKEQPKMIIYASAQAQKAIDYIMNN